MWMRAIASGANFLAVLLFAAAFALVAIGCDDGGDDPIEQLKDDAEEAREEVEDEIDDHT